MPALEVGIGEKTAELMNILASFCSSMRRILAIDAWKELTAPRWLHSARLRYGSSLLMCEAVRREKPTHVFLDRLLDINRHGREDGRFRTLLKFAKIATGVNCGVLRPLLSTDGTSAPRFAARHAAAS